MCIQAIQTDFSLSYGNVLTNEDVFLNKYHMLCGDEVILYILICTSAYLTSRLYTSK